MRRGENNEEAASKKEAVGNAKHVFLFHLALSSGQESFESFQWATMRQDGCPERSVIEGGQVSNKEGWDLQHSLEIRRNLIHTEKHPYL